MRLALVAVGDGRGLTVSWIRVDDKAPNHPKFLTAGPVASWLWICGQGYCATYLTDGFIPLAALPTFPVPDSQTHAERLVQANLWEVRDGGFQVHDYLDYQPSRAAVLARREEDAHRKRQERESPSPRTPSGVQTDSKRCPRARTRPSHPDPIPVPDPDPDPPSGEELSSADADPSVGPAEVAGLWNDTCDHAPIKAVTRNREAVLRSRVKEHPGIEWWRAYFGRIAASDFLTGRCLRSAEHANWRADFDWALRPAVILKVLEGKYDNRHGNGVRAGPTALTPAAQRTLAAGQAWAAKGGSA